VVTEDLLAPFGMVFVELLVVCSTHWQTFSLAASALIRLLHHLLALPVSPLPKVMAQEAGGYRHVQRGVLLREDIQQNNYTSLNSLFIPMEAPEHFWRPVTDRIWGIV
jgi:hypothetical protein